MTPWIVLGGGGHANVVVDSLLALDQVVLGFTDSAPERGAILGVEHLGDDAVLTSHAPSAVFLANGLGSTSSTSRRAEIFARFASQGYTFPSIVHPSAVVARSARLEAGAQIMAGAVVQPNCRIGENVLINTRASIDHGCIIEPNVHLAPGVTLSGDVWIEEGAHVGTGASVVQGTRVGAYAIVGAGALVLRDVPHRTTVIGVPARVK